MSFIHRMERRIMSLKMENVSNRIKEHKYTNDTTFQDKKFQNEQYVTDAAIKSQKVVF